MRKGVYLWNEGTQNRRFWKRRWSCSLYRDLKRPLSPRLPAPLAFGRHHFTAILDALVQEVFKQYEEHSLFAREDWKKDFDEREDGCISKAGLMAFDA